MSILEGADEVTYESAPPIDEYLELSLLFFENFTTSAATLKSICSANELL